MASSVKPRPNHYETLELAPTATDEEIREAFKRKISLFRTQPVSAAAQVCIAYETLRDPIKRQEYHDWLGLIPEPELEPSQLTCLMAKARWVPFIAAPDIPLSRQPATARTARSQPPAATERETEAPVHPKVAALAASLRELAKPAAPDGSTPEPKIAHQASPEPRPQVSVDELVQQIRDVGRAEKERLRYAENRPFDWKRPALVAGSLVVGAALFGALVGVSVKGEEAPAQAESAETVPLPAAARHLKIVDPSPSVAAMPVERRREPRVGAAFTSHKTKDMVSQKRRAALLEQQVLASLPAASAPAETDKDTQSTLDPAPAIAANLPLSSKVIARTIERIGYACGAVASTTVVPEQRAGVFRVACTSGDSYQATPISGRYRFRRVGRH